MTKILGPSFGNEVVAAGLSGAPFAWSDTDDSIDKSKLTPAQVATLNTVIANHNPATVVPPREPIDEWDIISLKIAFNHENRLRVLEGKAAVTVVQFKTAIKALL